MKMDIVELLRDFVMVPGVSGFESSIRRFLLEKLKNFDPKVDAVGNVYVTIGEGKEHIAIMAHMDEIGFVTTHIEDNGYIRFAPVGGVDDRMLYGRVVEIFTPKGTVYGVIGLIPPHLSTAEDKNKSPTWKELAIDVGAKSREEAQELGIGPVMPARWKKDFVRMGDYIVTRGIDDRAGCVVLFETLRRVQDKKLNKKVTFIWTVQEETGLRGASAITTRMEFDEVYAIDTMTSGMMPGVPFHLSPVKIGEGPAIRFFDRRGAASEILRDKVLKIAEKNGIPVQIAITGGSTDASAAFNHGLRALPICIPVKYTHSPVEMSNIADIKNAINLLEKIIEE
jgi:putative aminopeptidase FrvX